MLNTIFLGNVGEVPNTIPRYSCIAIHNGEEGCEMFPNTNNFGLSKYNENNNDGEIYHQPKIKIITLYDMFHMKYVKG